SLGCRSRPGPFDFWANPRQGDANMQYMLMIYDDESVWAKMPGDQRGRMHQEYMDFTQQIVKSGHFRAGARLQPVATTTTVKQKGGKTVTTDGPFIETKEQLGGYYLVECRDLDEALGLAGRIPSLKVGGSVEVRPVVPSESRPA